MRIRLLLILVAALGGAAPAAFAESRIYPPVHVVADDMALSGYDPVAYFTDGAAVAGSEAITLSWNGATWRFASTAHRDAFRASPEAYAPRFGGYCAWAASRGYVAPGDPQVWRIIDGRLYLNFNSRARMLWEADIPGNIARGEANWPRILTENQG